jgi:hypothetical protein
MVGETHIQPGEPVPGNGVYQEHNVFGTPTGRRVTLTAGDRLPFSPLGFTWTQVPTPADAGLPGAE